MRLNQKPSIFYHKTGQNEILMSYKLWLIIDYIKPSFFSRWPIYIHQWPFTDGIFRLNFYILLVARKILNVRVSSGFYGSLDLWWCLIRFVDPCLQACLLCCNITWLLMLILVVGCCGTICTINGWGGISMSWGSVFLLQNLFVIFEYNIQF